MINVVIFFCLLLLKVSATTCRSYENACSQTIGNGFVDDTGSSSFNLASKVDLYFKLELQTNKQIDIVGSILNGNIEIYAALGRKPKISDYDYKTNSFEYILNQIQNTQATSLTVFILVRAITDSTFRIMAIDPSIDNQLELGFMQTVSISGGKTYQFTFVPRSNTSKVNVVLTPFSRGDPNLVIAGPSIGGYARGWNSNLVGSDSILVDPNAEEVGKKFTIYITGVNNTKIYCNLIASESSTTHPTHILNGYPVEDRAEAEVNLFYVLTTFRSIADITITLNSVFGDVNLYVNPEEKGFFIPSVSNSSSSSPSRTQAIWQSERSEGVDSVLITHTNNYFLLNGGRYLITVHVVRSAQYTLNGVLSSTIQTIMEGLPLQNYISSKTYRYYRFVYDRIVNENLIVDVNPISGDPDLFVGCEIDPTGDDTGYPSRTEKHYNYSSGRTGEEGVMIRYNDVGKKCVGTYYLAVYAFSNTKFTISIVYEKSIVRLSDGIPYATTCYGALARYFQFVIGHQAEELTISLQPYTQDVDMFIKMNEEAHSYNYDFVSMLSGTKIEKVTIPETRICTNCYISVMVYAYHTTMVSVVASLEDSTITLTDSIPLRESVQSHMIQYYSIPCTTRGLGYVVLTVFSGKPMLYLSVSQEHPSSTTEGTKSNGDALVNGLPSITMSVEEGQHLFIGVGDVEDNCTFTVRASILPPNTIPLLKLLDSIPQADEIVYNASSVGDISQLLSEWKFYQINMPAGHESMSIKAGTLIGNVDLYILKCPYQNNDCVGNRYTRTTRMLAFGSSVKDGGEIAVEDEGHVESYLPTLDNFLYSTENLAFDTMTVSRNDDSSCSYIVGVHSLSYYAEYRLSLTFDSSMLLLQPGIQVTDHAQKGESDYFSLLLTGNLHQIVKFTLTPVSGDVDIFISTKHNRPNKTNCEWQSTNYGNDLISIDTDLDANACVGCIYYIAVLGYTEATYGLIASTESTVGRLRDGYPLSDEVTAFHSNHYSFTDTYGLGRDIKISITVLSGTPEVYVTLDGSTPTILNSQYTSRPWLTGNPVILIRHTDYAFAPCLDSNCVIRVTVFGMTGSSFILTVTSSQSNTQLQMGISMQAEIVQNTYDYFKVTYTEAADTKLYISVNEVSGYVALLASCHYPFPNATIHAEDWTLVPMYNGKNTITITRQDIATKHCTLRNVIYLSVYCFTPSATYSILATTSNTSSLPALLPGLTVTASVSYHQFNYYVIRPHDTYMDIQISILLTKGDVDVYISNSWDVHPTYNSVANEVSYYQLKSTSVGDENVVITHDSLYELCGGYVSLYTHDCYLVVGVFGVYDSTSEESIYRIMQSTRDITVTLSSNTAVRSHLSGGDGDMYKYSVADLSKDVVISVTATYGDPDIFVGIAPNYHPTETNNTWSSRRWGPDTLVIQHADLATRCNPRGVRASCDIYISVFAWQNSTYTIVAGVDEGYKHPIPLSDSVSQSSYVGQGQYSHFSFYVNANPNADLPTKVTFTLTSLDDSDQDMYVIFGGEREPGKTSFDLSSTSYGTIADEIIATPSMSFFCLNCEVHIAVYGFSGGQFSIVATSSGITKVNINQLIGGRSDGGSYRYYSFINADPLAVISISVSPSIGDPDIYVNTRHHSSDGADVTEPYSFPTKTSFMWHSMSVGGDQVSVSYTDVHFCYDCEYIIGIFAFANTSYTLLVNTREDAIIRLLQGHTQSITTTSKNIKYFRFDMMTLSEDITFSINKLTHGSLVMYVQSYDMSTYNESFVPSPTDSTSYKYSSKSSGLLYYKIPFSTFTESQTFVIGVVPDVDVISYAIMTSSVKHKLMLQSGIPHRSFVTQGSMEYYQFYVSELEDLVVSISSISGDPDLFVMLSDKVIPVCKMQSNYFDVACDNYTHASTSYLADQIIISKDFPCNAIVPSTNVSPKCNALDFHVGLITIAVYGYISTNYILTTTVKGQHVTLLPGLPQISSTSTGYMCTARSATGSCTSSSVETVQAAYFVMQVTESSEKEINNILLAVKPDCLASTSGAVGCQAGCNCNKIALYMKTCAMSKCKPGDKYPSHLWGQHDASLVVFEEGSSLLLTIGPNAPPPGNIGGGYNSKICDPQVEKEPCLYYLSVISRQTEQSVTFNVLLQEPNDIQLVACESKVSGDRIRSLAHQYINPTFHKNYEVCGAVANYGAPSSGMLENNLISLEVCVGDVAMYACTSNNPFCESYMPTLTKWAYYTDKDQTCTHTVSGRNAQCIDINTDNGESEIVKPSFTIPVSENNVFLQVNGTGIYDIKIQTSVSGEMLTPSLIVIKNLQANLFQSVTEYIPQTHTITDTTVQVSWLQTSVLMPSAVVPISTPNIRYSIYIIDTKLMDSIHSKSAFGRYPLHYHSLCGLRYILEDGSYVSAIKVRVLFSNEIELSDTVYHELKHLRRDTEYLILINSECDGECLSQITKTSTAKSSLSCKSASDCSSYSKFYRPLYVRTSSKQTSDSSSDEDSSSDQSLWLTYKMVLLVSVSFIIGLTITILVVVKFRGVVHEIIPEEDPLSSLEMTDFSFTNSHDKSRSQGRGVGMGFDEEGSSSRYITAGGGSTPSETIGDSGPRTSAVRAFMSRVTMKVKDGGAKEYSLLGKDIDDDEITINL